MRDTERQECVDNKLINCRNYSNILAFVAFWGWVGGELRALEVSSSYLHGVTEA